MLPSPPRTTQTSASSGSVRHLADALGRGSVLLVLVGRGDQLDAELLADCGGGADPFRGGLRLGVGE